MNFNPNQFEPHRNPDMPNLQDISLSKSDGEFFTMTTGHWWNCAISGNASMMDTCSNLMIAYCQRFVRKGVADE